jgi:4-amino-4-deoxy-L-arabinose transferase-like glycosyltransferase
MRIERTWLGAGLVLFLALAYHFTALATIPPGLDRDAAANGWMALNWLRDGLVPFWMPHASAPEPLIVWLQTAMTALLGPSVAALRSASALFLALAAPVVYFLTLEVAKPFSAAQRGWAALLAGLVFACNPVITQLARTGLRATTLPLLSGLFFLLLLRAWRTNQRRDFAVAGLALGLASYTYLAARFLPIVVVLFVLLAWWGEFRNGEPTSIRSRWVGLVLMGVAALAIVLPQLIFFILYPAAFWERAQSVSLLSNPDYAEIGLARLLVDKVAGMALSYGVEWSGQYNQAARPLLSPLPFVGLLLSLPLIVRWRRHAAMLLMVVAWFVFLLPDLIGGDRVMPHELRVIGAFVPIMVLSGVGMAYALVWVTRVNSARAAMTVAGATLGLLIAVWAVVDWFGVAAPALARSDYEWFARSDVAIAEVINGTDVPVLVPLNDYSRSVIAYLSAKRISHLGSGIDADGEIVQPSSSRVLLLWPSEPGRVRVESTSYRFDPESLVLIDGNRAFLMPPAQADVAHLQSGCGAQPFMTATSKAAGSLCEVDFSEFDFSVFDFAGELPALLSTEDSLVGWPVGDLYAGVLRLHGISAGSRVLVAGEEMGITTYWQAEQRTTDRWRYFVHLLDDRQQLIAGDDLVPGYGVYSTELWQRDEIVPIRQSLILPDDLSAGRYWLEVGLYDPLSGQRAPISTGGDRSLVGSLKVPLAAGTELPEATPLAAQFGNEIALDGYQLERDEAELRVTLRLAALRQPDHDYTFFLHVEDDSGEIVAQSDAQPVEGQYPTSIWDAGEVVVADWRVPLPPALEAGAYRIWIGLYEWQSGARLPVQSGGALVDADRLLLSEVDLR